MSKELCKTLISLVIHPLLGIILLRNGINRFKLGKRLKCRHYMNHIQIGNDFSIGDDARILFISEYHGGKYTPFLKIGKGVNIGDRFSCLCTDLITIGDRTLIAGDVFISSENHGMEIDKFSSYGDTPLISKPVSIGKGCWIGEKAIILPGVHLGDRCIVGAGAIVTKSFPDRVIIGGNPAKIIKRYNNYSGRWENEVVK